MVLVNPNINRAYDVVFVTIKRVWDERRVTVTSANERLQWSVINYKCFCLCATSKTPTRKATVRTKYGDDHAVFEYLERTVTDEVDAVDGICLVYDILARRAEHRFDLHRDSFEATLWCLTKYRQRQHLSMQVHCYVSLHLDREIFKHLHIPSIIS